MRSWGQLTALKNVSQSYISAKGWTGCGQQRVVLRVQIFPSSYSVLLEAELNRRHPKCELPTSPYVVSHKYHIVIETQGFRYLRDHLGNFSLFNSWMSSLIPPSLHLPLFTGIAQMNYLIISKLCLSVKKKVDCTESTALSSWCEPESVSLSTFYQLLSSTSELAAVPVSTLPSGTDFTLTLLPPHHHHPVRGVTCSSPPNVMGARPIPFQWGNHVLGPTWVLGQVSKV